MRLPAEQLRLYLVTDTALCTALPGRTVADVVRQAVAGGVTCVQLRDKTASTRDLVALARAVQHSLSGTGVPLVINDRIDVALACGAQGVHLGQSDMGVADARRLLPEHVFLGLSVERMADVHEAQQLNPEWVDYFGVSPVFATPTKTDTAPPWGLAGLAQVRAATALPLVAIGGVSAQCASDLRAAGADGLAVVSAICAATDPKAAAQALLTAFST
jgi:thiamine-phosphate pyrophosphorylase